MPLANRTATLTIGLTYVAPGGASIVIPQLSMDCLYQAQSEGQTDIPDATTTATAFAVNFGSIAKASLLLMVNNCTQEMIVKINGSLAIFNLPAGGYLAVSSTTLPASTPLTAATLTTTDTVSGAGTIDYWVFGDQV